MIIGYFIVLAEPAVFVLTKQVEEMTSEAISAKAITFSLPVTDTAGLRLIED